MLSGVWGTPANTSLVTVQEVAKVFPGSLENPGMHLIGILNDQFDVSIDLGKGYLK